MDSRCETHDGRMRKRRFSLRRARTGARCFGGAQMEKQGKTNGKAKKNERINREESTEKQEDWGEKIIKIVGGGRVQRGLARVLMLYEMV